MNFKYVDNHAHLNLPQFKDDIKDVVSRAENAGVGIINVGTNKETSQKAVEIAYEFTSCRAIVGQHPTEEIDFDYGFFLELARDQKVVGVGECGLDYFRSGEDTKEKQKEVFKRQIELALELNKPLMLHIRDNGKVEAYEDAMGILKKYKKDNPSLRGNVHFFAGTLEIARQFIEMGFTISFTGVVTFAKSYEELVRCIPLENILSETDCPFVAPVPYRGKRNEPMYVAEVVKKIAEIKELSLDEVAEQLLKNSKRLWGV